MLYDMTLITGVDCNNENNSKHNYNKDIKNASWQHFTIGSRKSIKSWTKIDQQQQFRWELNQKQKQPSQQKIQKADE